jgi:Ca2+-binding EF-hand superfamily protein
MSFKSKSTFVDHDKVKALFEKYDFNKNGVLEPDEFLQIMVDILRQLGEELPDKKHQEVAEEGLMRFDLNGNGTIEFNEFYEFINFLVAEKGYSL